MAIMLTVTMLKICNFKKYKEYLKDIKNIINCSINLLMYD